MTFFNKKEEVIQIELTPYGKSLMANGKLKPEFYAFFDDDVMYCSTLNAGFGETQEETQRRILQETPSIKTQRCLQSPERLISLSEQSEENTYPHIESSMNFLTEPLGTSDGTSDYAPSWNATFIRGSISGSVGTYLSGTYLDSSDIKRGSKQHLKFIPQVDSTVEYHMRVQNINDEQPVRGRQNVPSAPNSNIFPDGTYIKILPDQILCRLMEDHGFSFKDSLELQVFLYEDQNNDIFRPLKFMPNTNLVKDDILMESNNATQIEIDPSYVEYYINFKTDSLIPEKDICEGIQFLKSQNIDLDLDINCTETDTQFFNIYGTRVEEIEDCD